MEALNRVDAAKKQSEWRRCREYWLIQQQIASLDRLLWVQNELSKLGVGKPPEPIHGRKVS